MFVVERITQNKVFREKAKAPDDVLACSITTTEIGRRSTGDLSTATKEAGERLYCARDAPPFWRTAPDLVLKRCRIERGRRGARGWRSRRWRFGRRWLLVPIALSLLLLLLLGLLLGLGLVRMGIDG
jgi:hypothetical protein